MVARVVRLQGKLFIELDASAETSLSGYEGRQVDVRVDENRVVITPGVDPAFDAQARELLTRHAATFEKLSK